MNWVIKMEKHFNKNYQQLIFQLVEYDLVNGFDDCWNKTMTLFNHNEGYRMLDLFEVDMIVDDDFFKHIINGIEEMKMNDKPNISKSFIRYISSKKRKTLLHIDGNGNFKEFIVRKLNPKNLSDYMKIQSNNYVTKNIYELRYEGMNYKSFYKLTNRELPNIDTINQFFKYQKLVRGNIKNWYSKGLRWNINRIEFNDLKNQNYNQFLMKMDKRLFLRGVRENKKLEKNEIGKGIFCRYWEWDDYKRLKVRRKTKQHSKEIDGYIEFKSNIF